MEEFESYSSVLSTSKKNKEIRGKILYHSKRLFGKKGYCAVSMNDLVAQIGITKPTIYYYFIDKETLFVETIIDMLRRGQELFSESIVCRHSFREKLYRLCDGYFQYTPMSLLTIVRDVEENLNQSHQIRIRDAHYHYLIHPIQILFEEGMYTGEIKNDNARELAVFFLNWVDTLSALQGVQCDQPIDFQDRARRAVDMFMDGIAYKP